MRDKQRRRRSRWLALGLLLAASLGIGLMAGCSDDEPKTPVASGPAVCRDLDKQAGLEEAMIRTISNQAKPEDRATITKAANRLRQTGTAPGAAGDLRNRLADAANMLDVLASGKKLTDDEVEKLSATLKFLGQEVQKTCSTSPPK